MRRKEQRIGMRRSGKKAAACRSGGWRRILFPVLLCFVMMILAACSGTGGNPSSESGGLKDSGGAGAGERNERVLDDIKNRGFLIVGCKTDVPGLGLYDSETDTWSGLECELAWRTAAKLFDVTIEKAKEKKLVHFVGVTVADREEKLENGEVDCIIATYTITKERAERFSLSGSYYTDYIGLMVRTSGKDADSVGTGDIESVADLDGKYIGVPRNATTREDFTKYINTLNNITVNPIFCEYEGYEVLYKALIDGNIDVMSVDVSILKGYLTNKTKILDDRFAGQNYAAAAKKENALLTEVISEAVEEQKELQK